MAEIASAFVSLLPSARGFGSKMESQISGEVDGVGKKSGGVFAKAFGAAAAIGAGAALGGFFKGAIEGASDLQEAGTKIEAIFGGGSAAVQKFASQGAAALGQTRLEVLNASSTFGTFGKAAGLAGTDLAKFSTGFASLSTDLASFYNTSPEEAVEAIGAALRGEAEPIRKYGVLLDDATLRQEALALGLVKTTKEALTPQQKVLAAQAAIYKQTSDAQGDFERTSGGLANQQRILSASFKDMQATVGSALLPTVTSFVTFLNSSAMPALSSFGSFLSANIGPAFQAVSAAVSPFIAQAQSALLPVIQQIATAVSTQFGPAIQAAGTTFTTVVIPAVAALVAYLASRLFPIFQQVVGIITGQVIPIVASFAAFLYGTLYPAVVQLATAIASQLRPIFDALVSTISGSVLPAVVIILAKFREWQPTIQRVIGVVVPLIAKVLEFAAAILGRVLPPLVRFAGFILGNAVPAIAAMIGIVVKIIDAVFDFGSAVLDTVADVARFVVAVKEKFGEAVNFIQGIPAKIKAAIGDLSFLLYSAGQAVMTGFIAGISSKVGELTARLVSITGLIPANKGPIEKDRVLLRPAGQAIMDGLVDGLTDREQKLKDKLKGITDTLRATIDGIRSDIASLSGSVQTAFTGNLFEATTADTFLGDLSAARNQAGALTRAFRKLMKWGLDARFLSSLFQSGNSALIFDLAAGSRMQARLAADRYAGVQSLTQQLGQSVARNQYGPQLDRAVNRLERIEVAIKQIGRDVGNELNRAGAAATRRR